MTKTLEHLPLAANLAVFFVLAAGVWIAGSQLTRIADEVSERFNLAKSVVGLVFLATATSLPEIATTFTAALVPDAPLVLNNLFGGIALQTAMLAFADMMMRGAITNYPRKATHALEATLLVSLLAMIQVISLTREPVEIFWIGLGSLVVGIAYMTALFILRSYDRNTDWVPVDPPEEEEGTGQKLASRIAELPNAGLIAAAVLACAAIYLLGVSLVTSAEVLAAQTGLGSSFVGVTLLAAATSLPELATTIAAVRIGAYTLAISNIFGSNLIMVVLVLPADILFFEGPILRAADTSANLAIGLGMFVTAVYLTGLIIRRKPRVGRLGLDSFVVLVTWLFSLLLFYAVR